MPVFREEAMRNLVPLISVILTLLVTGGCRTMRDTPNTEVEIATIKKVIANSIGWAATKDKELLYGCFAQDDELFYFCPRDDGTIHGFEAFTELTDGFFMLDDFKAIHYEIRDLHVELSQSGDVAWYHARLDDYNEWKGQPANWEDVRWTGVLEKRDGRWVIVQMHFSSPTDRPEPEEQDPAG
jgi:ketosteroid isomerase-like protein